MPSLIARYQQEHQAACHRLRAGSQLFHTSMGEIEAALTGDAGPAAQTSPFPGPSQRTSAVLISHGSAGGYDMGLWLAQLIGGQNHYIAPSRFGYLRSPVPPVPDPQAQADTYAALLDTLQVDSAVIIGLSAGGPSALQFALRHAGRCHGLILLSAASRAVPPLSPLLQAIYPFMLRSDFIPWLLYTTAPQVVFQGNGVSRALLARIQPDREKMRLLDALYQTTFPSTLRRDGMINDLRQLTSFLSYPIEQITVPTLVVHAVNDPVMPFAMGEFSASAIPNAQFLRLADGGHFACVTHREETIPRLQEFLISAAINSR